MSSSVSGGHPGVVDAERPAPPRVVLPERALFWRWVWSAVRPVVGWVLAALGALGLFLGWYGVSGQTLTAKQIPYLVSGGLGGVALVVLAGVFLATDDVRRQLGRLDAVEEKVAALYALFVEELAAPTAAAEATASAAASRAGAAEAAASPPVAEGLVALPAGTSYHRPGCPLVAGKANAAPVGAAAVTARGLRACRVCDPSPTVG